MLLIVQCVLWHFLVNIHYCGLNSPYPDLPLLAWNAPLPLSLSWSEPLSLHPGIQEKRLKLLLSDGCTKKKKKIPCLKTGEGRLWRWKVTEISMECGCEMSEISRECSCKINTVGTCRTQDKWTEECVGSSRFGCTKKGVEEMDF